MIIGYKYCLKILNIIWKEVIQLKNYYKGICKNYKEANKKIQSVIILMDSTDVVYGKFF